MIYLNGLPLQTVTEIRYLGVIIDSKLSFKSHISSIISKAYGALKTLARAQASLPLSIRKRLYKALVLPILEYCPSVWDPSTSTLSDRIEKVQNKAMRIILNKPLGISSHPLRLELQWRSLHDRRLYRRALSTFKSINKLSPPYLHNLFTYNIHTRGRNHDKLYVIRPLTNWYKNSFTYRSTKLWNSLTKETRHATSIKHFNYCFFNM